MVRNKYLNKKVEFLLNYFIIIMIVSILLILYTLKIISYEFFLITLIAVIGLLPLIKIFIDKKMDPMKPKAIISFVYIMYALGPLFYKDDFSVETVNTYLLFQLLGLISLTIGLNKSKKYKKPKKNEINPILEDNNSNIDSLKLTSITFLLLSLFSTLSELISYGGIYNLIAVGYGGDKFLHSDNSFMIGGGFQWLLLSGIIVWYYGIKVSSKSIRFYGLFFIGISASIFTLVGGRSTLVYSVIFASVIYFYEKRKVNNKLIIIIIIIGVVGAQLYSNARFYLPLGIVQAIKSTFKIFINDPSSFIPLPSNINEFRAPVKTLLELLEYGSGELLLGRSYISAIGSPFPFINRLFMHMGINPSLWFMEEYHPEILASGGGVGFSPLSEGYMNFGVIGIILHMYLYGRIISLIYNNYKEKQNISSLLLYAGVLPIFALDGLRIHTASMLYKLFRIYLMPYIIYTFLKILKKDKRIAHNNKISTKNLNYFKE